MRLSSAAQAAAYRLSIHDTLASTNAENQVTVIGQNASDVAPEHAGRPGQENGIRCGHAP